MRLYYPYGEVCVSEASFCFVQNSEQHHGNPMKSSCGAEGSEKSDRWILKVWCLTFKGILCMMDRAYGL